LADPLDDCWLKLVASYSGLSDLSVPTWLLSWLLVKPGGMVAYVTANSHQNRTYGRMLQYFMLRMLEPIFCVEQSGNQWFPNAQVPTSLMVFRARTRHEASRPLADRGTTDREFVRLRLHAGPDAEWIRWAAPALDEPSDASNPNSDAHWADSFARRLVHVGEAGFTGMGKMEMLREQDLVDQLLHEENSDRTDDRLFQLEGTTGRPERISAEPIGFQLPRSITLAIGLHADESRGVRALGQAGVVVNQGLRTGCNGFFYVKEADAADCCHLVGAHSFELTRQAVSEGGILSAFARTELDRMRQGGAIVPADNQSLPPSVIVRLSALFQDRIAVLPRDAVRPVIRNQRSLGKFVTIADANIRDLVLVTGEAGRPADIVGLSAYPQEWLTGWIANGLRPLVETVTGYIDTAETAQVKVKGRLVLIPTLSAVSPNVRQPPAAKSILGPGPKQLPLPPKWWYSLPIKDRHRADLFVPRIVHETSRAYLSPDPQSMMIDANFSTITLKTSELDKYALLAILNSVLAIAALEAIATPMGGGALKVEAAHLAQLAIPRPTSDALKRLASLGIALAGTTDEKKTEWLVRCIDREVVGTVVDAERVDDVTGRLRAYASDARRKRSRVNRAGQVDALVPFSEEADEAICVGP